MDPENFPLVAQLSGLLLVVLVAERRLIVRPELARPVRILMGVYLAVAAWLLGSVVLIVGVAGTSDGWVTWVQFSFSFGGAQVVGWLAAGLIAEYVIERPVAD